MSRCCLLPDVPATDGSVPSSPLPCYADKQQLPQPPPGESPDVLLPIPEGADETQIPAIRLAWEDKK